MYHLLFTFLFALFVSQVTAQNFVSSNLPLVFIDTEGQRIIDEPKRTVKMKILNNSSGTNSIGDTDFEYDGFAGIEVRGNTSQRFDKQSFSFETRDEMGENRNVSLLGMPEENDWVLQGPYADKSLLRNVIAYHIGNSMGRWSPRTHFCEVFINDEYRGVYVLMEKIKIDKGRVDIAKLKPEDIVGDELTGGYIMSIDRDNEGSWNSPFMGRTGNVDVPISYVDPDYEDLTDEQREYIREYITDFEYALDGSDFKNPTTGYRAYIDVTSFIDYFIITELSRDLDGYRCSVYFHKDKDSKGGKLNMSPFWDYNLGFGNGDFMKADDPVGWTADGIGRGDWYEVPFWWDRLREDPYFNTKLKYRWNQLRNECLDIDNLFAFIDSCGDVLNEAQVRNFKKYKVLDKYLWPNAYVGGSYQNELGYLRGWIWDRIAWLDEEMDDIVADPTVSSEQFETNENFVSVYPNPFIDHLKFRLSLINNSAVEVIVMDGTGKVINHSKNNFSRGLHELSFGDDLQFNNHQFYLYTVKINGSLVKSGKLIRKRI